MNHINVSRRAALVTSAAMLALSIADPAMAQATTEQDSPTTTVAGEVNPEEIVITAQKREETLREIPQSVTVLGGGMLERQQADNFLDYLGLVPGLSVESSQPGTTRLTLRGLNTGGVASTVAVYVDEVPFGSSSGLANAAIFASDFDTFDISRIEILRGPQGTLYGSSSLGGVIKYVTNKPKIGKFEGRAKIGIESVKGGDIGYSATGAINLPLGDRIAVRATGFYRFDDGFIDSTGLGPIASLSDPTKIIIPGSMVKKNINDAKRYGGRLSALYQATDDFSIRLTALGQNIESGSSNYYEVDPVTLKSPYDELTQSRFLLEPQDIKYRIYSGTVDWNLGFANLTSITSFGKLTQNSLADITFGFASLLTGIFSTDDRPIGLLQEQNLKTTKFTQEVRLSSPDSETFEWLLGAYYTREKADGDVDAFGFDLRADEIASDLPILGIVTLDSIYREYAGFANATYHFSPRFDLTFGGRLSRNKQVADQTRGGAFFPASDIPNNRSSETVFTYSVAPRYEITDDIAVYARIASGYRPGGPNVIPIEAPPGTPTSYDADSTVNYEIGIKGDFFNRALSVDASVFYINWDDIQLFAVVNDTGVNANGGTAISKGVEASATVRPIEGLSALLNVSYTDAYLTQDTGPFVGGFDGDSLPFVPKWSGGISADYEWDIGAANAFVGGSLRVIGDSRANFDFGFRTATGRQRKVPGYEVVDLRTGINFQRFSVEAFVKNIADVRGKTSIGGFFPGGRPNDTAIVAVVRPRTIGLTLATKF